MAGYAIHVKASVERDIAALPRDVLPRIFQSIEALSETPLPFGVRKLGGAEHLYRIRVGDYRIVYAVHHTEQEVIILYVQVAVHTVGCEIENRAPLPRSSRFTGKRAGCHSPLPGGRGDCRARSLYGEETRYPDSIVGNLTPSEYYDREDAGECIEYADSICSAARRSLSG